MSVYRLICLIIIITTLVACDNSIYFDKPQPDDTKNLHQIPSKYHGQYVNSDSTVLNINKNTICLKTHLFNLIPLNDLDTNDYIYTKGKGLIDKKTNMKSTLRIVNDTVYLPETEVDTLFSLNRGDILRRMKNNLILNIKTGDFWQINIVNKKHNILNFIKITTKETFNKLSQLIIIDSVTNDTTQMVLKPSRKEFKRILGLKDSLQVDEFVEIK